MDVDTESLDLLHIAVDSPDRAGVLGHRIVLHVSRPTNPQDAKHITVEIHAQQSRGILLFIYYRSEGDGVPDSSIPSSCRSACLVESLLTQGS